MKKSSDLLKGILLGSLISSFVFAGLAPHYVRAQNNYAFDSVNGGTVPPAGSMKIITTGTCGTGWTENSTFSGKTLVGTVAANGDVGTTGGNDTITPTVATLTAAAQTFTGNAGTVPAETFTGSSATTSAVSAGTPAGTNGTTTTGATSSGTPAGTISALTTGADSSTTGGVAKAIAQTPTFTGSALSTHTHTVPAETFTGSALATHTHTLTATGTNGTASFTPAGSNGTSSVTGTLNSFDNRPAYVKVIYCQKT